MDAVTLHGKMTAWLALRHGTIPLVWAAEERDAALEAYVQRHLREEIRAEALLRAVKKQLGPMLAEEIGPLFEGFVLHLLRAHAEEQKLFDELTYWAPAQAMRTEVDFLLRRQREFIAIEVKASKRFDRSMVQGLRAIAELPGVVRRILVYAGERSLRVDEDIEVWPIRRFSEALALGRLWP